jgi:hypothetical protein
MQGRYETFCGIPGEANVRTDIVRACSRTVAQASDDHALNCKFQSTGHARVNIRATEACEDPRPRLSPVRLPLVRWPFQNERPAVCHLELSSAGRADVPPVRPREDLCFVRRATPRLPTRFTAPWGTVRWRGHLPLLLDGPPDVPPTIPVAVRQFYTSRGGAGTSARNGNRRLHER